MRIAATFARLLVPILALDAMVALVVDAQQAGPRRRVGLLMACAESPH